MKNVELYGENFEVIYPKDGVCEVVPTAYDYMTIYTAYDKPSIYKQDIWHYWEHFGLVDDEKYPYHIGIPFITGRNCFSFTVTFNVYDIDTREFKGVARITKEHNRLYLNK